MEPYGPTLYFKYLTVGVGKEKSVEEKETREGGGCSEFTRLFKGLCCKNTRLIHFFNVFLNAVLSN